jgi:hypothetical protein
LTQGDTKPTKAAAVSNNNNALHVNAGAANNKDTLNIFHSRTTRTKP